MRFSFTLAAVLTAAVVSSQCGGGGNSNDTPTSPGNTGTTPITVSIVTTNGNKSFVPNPVATSLGQQVIFKNNDTINTHHIVMDDGSADFGTLAPGTTSAAKAVGTGGNFHCANHPSMVGSINGATAPEPAPGSGDGY